MNPIQFLQAFAFGESEQMLRDRERIMGGVALVISVVTAPFLIHALWQQRLLEAALAGIVLASMLADALALRRGRRPPVPFPLLFVPILLAIALTVVNQGVMGALWSYPALFICQFVLSRRSAFVCSMLLMVSTTALIAQYAGSELALRVAATQAVIWVMVNIVLNVLNRAHRELQLQAATDPLTGASNRRQLDIALAEMVRRARRRPVPASVVLIDIDNFKQINDGFGHAVGDRVLVGIVKLMSERKRTADSLFRLGGEEFLLLAPETTGKDASGLAEQLRAMVEKTPLVEGLTVQVSMGVAECRTDQQPHEWLEEADRALYRAKESGRNRVENSNFSDSAFKLTL